LAENRDFFIPTVFDAPLGGSPRNIAIPFCMKNWNGVATRWWKSLMICLAVSTEYRPFTDGRMDGHTDRQTDIFSTA